MAVWGQSSPLVETSWSVYLDLSALLSDTEPTQVLPAREEIFEPPVIAHDAVNHASAGAHDLRGQQDDCVQKRRNSILIKPTPRWPLGRSKPNQAFRFQAKEVITI